MVQGRFYASSKIERMTFSGTEITCPSDRSTIVGSSLTTSETFRFFCPETMENVQNCSHDDVCALFILYFPACTVTYIKAVQ